MVKVNSKLEVERNEFLNAINRLDRWEKGPINVLRLLRSEVYPYYEHRPDAPCRRLNIDELVKEFASLPEFDKALIEWAKKHNLFERWLLDKALDTLDNAHQGATNPPEGIPPLPVEHQAFLFIVWSNRDVSKALLHPFIFSFPPPTKGEPLAEYENFLRHYNETALKRYLNEVKEIQKEEEYKPEQSTDKEQLQHYEWYALSLIASLKASEIVELYAAYEDLGEKVDEKSPDPTTITRGIRDIAKRLKVESPLRQGRPKKMH